jgi:hypothetical protein
VFRFDFRVRRARIAAPVFGKEMKWNCDERRTRTRTPNLEPRTSNPEPNLNTN